ncbi:MAG: protein kinase [Anaerolineaceae bacterium]
MLSVNQVIHNRYRIERLVGQGGFGAVYQVWDMKLNLTCALKENFETSPAAQRQFNHEATILSGLHHAALPHVTEYFTLPGQGQYLVMDYVEGIDLKTRLEQNGAPLSVDQTLLWVLQVADALAYLHSQKPPIIHRDLKPENIIITPAGKAMLVDFGVAKVYDPSLKTTIGARAVTPGFSPPEQYGHGTTDARSDIYALGATLYTLLTNQEPVESVQRTLRIPLVAPRQLNPSIPPSLEAAILKAMEPVPADRYQRMEHFRAALTHQQNMAPIPNVKPAPVPQKMAVRKSTRGSGILSKNLTLLLGLIVLFLIGTFILLGLVRATNNPSSTLIAETPHPNTPFVAATTSQAGTVQAGSTMTVEALLPVVTAIPTNTPQHIDPTASKTKAFASKTPINRGAYTCVLISYIDDITVPDGTIFTPESKFVKTWRLQNASDCTLEEGAHLVYLGGELFDGEKETVIPIKVVPGQVFDMSIELAAPEIPGEYKGEWGIKTKEGSLISGLILSVEIRVR